MNKVILSVAFIIIGCMCLVSCVTKQPPPNPVVPVNLFKVTPQKVFYYDKYPSTTVALSQVDLTAQVQGYITAINFTEGSHVTKGQVLYEIDKRLYQANYDAAEANLKVAQGNMVQAQQDADRYTYLNKEDAVAKQLYDHAVIALQNADNSVKAAEEAVKTAKTNMSYSTITAPFNGTIGISQVRLGNLVNVGQTVLNTISTDEPMAVDFLINEKQLLHYQELDKEHQSPTDSLFTIILPNNTLYPYTGKISIIDRAVDPLTGTVRVRLVFPNPNYSLRAGMSCVVRVHNEDTLPQMVIPGRAIVEQMGEYFVFVAKDTIMTNPADTSHKKSADTSQSRPRLLALQKKVQLGQTIGPNVIIKKGINVGDAIVVDGIQTLHDGSQIAISKKQGPQQGGSGGNAKADSSKNKQGKNGG